MAKNTRVWKGSPRQIYTIRRLFNYEPSRYELKTHVKYKHNRSFSIQMTYLYLTRSIQVKKNRKRQANSVQRNNFFVSRSEYIVNLSFIML